MDANTKVFCAHIAGMPSISLAGEDVLIPICVSARCCCMQCFIILSYISIFIVYKMYIFSYLPKRSRFSYKYKMYTTQQLVLVYNIEIYMTHLYINLVFRSQVTNFTCHLSENNNVPMDVVIYEDAAAGRPNGYLFNGRAHIVQCQR